MINKVLVTGGSGLLGSNLIMIMGNQFVAHAIVNNHQMRFKTCQVHQLDITNGNDLLNLVKKIHPQWIIHTAALTNVDYCEVHRDHAWKVNVEGTRNIVTAAETTHSKIVYISTDSIFDGEKGMYTEEDLPNPLNFYALTKLEGEKIVCISNVPHIIIRTNIYGWNAQNKSSLAEWMLTSLRDKKKLTLFSDVFFTPILVNNLSDAIMEMLKKDFSGLFHVAGSERCSKLQFGLILAEIFELDRNLIEPVTLSTKNLIAKRPVDPSLSIERIKGEIETNLLNVKDGLKAFKNLSDSGYVKELRKCAL
jgi:dTDP-4-dehydrorhamnose reductase